MEREKMRFHYTFFKLFQSVNIASYMRVKLRTSIFQNWLYVAIPLLFFSGNIRTLFKKN